MARLGTAAAGGLAWAAILLMCAALVAGQGNLFIKDTLPPPVRIYSRQDSTLNIAVSDDGNRVVLARGSCSDPRQQWIMILGAPTRPGTLPFALQNLATRQVITIPSTDGPVGLSSMFDSSKGGGNALLQDLWKLGEPNRENFAPLYVNNKDKKFKLIVKRNPNGRIDVGSQIMISSTASETAINAIWELTSYPPCFDPNKPIPTNPNRP